VILTTDKLPERILTDRGSQFISSEFTGYLKKNNIKASLTSTYHPQCDGLTERANQNILNKLRLLQPSKNITLKEKIKMGTQAINNSTNSTTDRAPQSIINELKNTENQDTKKKKSKNYNQE
jgi:transposase InsO family protein